MSRDELLFGISNLETIEDASFEERAVKPESYQEGFHWGYKAALKAVKELFSKAGAFFIVVFLFVCCSSDSLTQHNDNAEFYDTEWSSSDKSEGLKFYDDNTVLEFVSSGYRGTGTFEYYKDMKWIKFHNLETFFPTYTTVTTSAFVQDDGSLKVVWHKLGEDKNYYVMMYKRR